MKATRRRRTDNRCRTAILAALLCSWAFASPVSAQRWTKITRTDDVREHNFGHSLAVVDDYLIVSGYRNNLAGPYSGAVYAYRLDEPDFPPVQVLLASNEQEYDGFGWEIAASGNDLLVGTGYRPLLYHFELENGQFVEKQILEVPGLTDGRWWTSQLQFDGTWVVFNGSDLAFEDGTVHEGYATVVFRWNGNEFEFSDFPIPLAESNRYQNSLCLADGMLAVKDNNGPLIRIFEDSGFGLELQRIVDLGAAVRSGEKSLACTRDEIFLRNDEGTLLRVLRERGGDWNVGPSLFHAPADIDVGPLLGWIQILEDYLFLQDSRSVGPAGADILLVFRRNAGNWDFLQELWPPELRSDTYGFGDDIALSDGFLMVGSQWENYWPRPDPSRVYHLLDQNGAVYIIRRNEIAPKLRRPEVMPSTSEGPEAAAIALAFPNPANHSVTLRFDVAEKAPVSVFLYDTLGRSTGIGFQGVEESGRHEGRLDVSALPSGVYFYRVSIGRATSTFPIVVQH